MLLLFNNCFNVLYMMHLFFLWTVLFFVVLLHLTWFCPSVRSSVRLRQIVLNTADAIKKPFGSMRQVEA